MWREDEEEEVNSEMSVGDQMVAEEAAPSTSSSAQQGGSNLLMLPSNSSPTSSPVAILPPQQLWSPNESVVMNASELPDNESLPQEEEVLPDTTTTVPRSYGAPSYGDPSYGAPSYGVPDNYNDTRHQFYLNHPIPGSTLFYKEDFSRRLAQIDEELSLFESIDRDIHARIEHNKRIDRPSYRSVTNLRLCATYGTRHVFQGYRKSLKRRMEVAPKGSATSSASTLACGRNN